MAATNTAAKTATASNQVLLPPLGGSGAGWSSLAVIDEDRIQDGAEVTLVWGEEGGGSAKPTVERHVQAEVRATISTSPLAR